MLLRIPLPVKLLLSYLLVVAAGALPTFLFLRAELASHLLSDAARATARQAGSVARVLAELPEERRKERLRILATAFPGRISYIAASGEVLFDTHVANPLALASHADRPEVRVALGRMAQPPLSFAPAVDGVGIARRVSATTGTDTLYAAIRLPDAEGPARVLRLARSVESIEAAGARTVTVLRNAQAFAISLALGLTLLCAVLFARPLRRVRETLDAFAAGDYAKSPGRAFDDEVGDLCQALEQLGAALRRRMAMAGSGEALLMQLVEVVPAPLLVFEPDGEVVAINGPARRRLQVEDPSAGRRLRALLENDEMREALSRAEDEGEPEQVELDFGAGPVTGWVHVLKRPGIAPLQLFFMPPLPSKETTLLPPPDHVAPRPLAEVVEAATRDAAISLDGNAFPLDLPKELPQVFVADADGRLSHALFRALVGCSHALAGRPGALAIDVEVQKTRIGIALDAAPSQDVVADIRPLLEPLGGEVEVTQGEVTLWLPRA